MRVAQDALGHTAQHEAQEARATMGRQRNQIAVVLLGKARDALGDVRRGTDFAVDFNAASEQRFLIVETLTRRVDQVADIRR